MIKQYWLEYQQFTIGFSQIILSRDSKYFWIFIEVVAHLQKLALLFLFKVIMEILQVRIFNHYIKTTDQYSLFELMSKLSVPTILLFDSLTYDGIIVIQSLIILFLYGPIVFTFFAMHKEKFEYSTIKYCSSIDDQDNLNYNLNLLNRSYNMHNYIEYFLQKQFMGNEQSSFKQMEKFMQASFLNIYPHIIVIPLLIWTFVIWNIIFYDDKLVGYQFGFMIFFNIINNIGTLLVWYLSMQIQQTFTIRDNNHLRLIKSFWFNLSQLIIILPIIIQQFYFIMYQDSDYDNNSTHYYLNNATILILQIGNLIEFFICLPFMETYKTETILIIIPFTITVIISLISQHNQIEIISISLIAVPLVSRFLNEIKKYRSDQILYQSQYKEKQRSKVRAQSKTGLLVEEEQQFVIEKELNNQRQIQLEFLQNQNSIFFIHYLRLVDLMRLDNQQIIEKDNSVINVSRSKFLLNVIVLLKQHIIVCDNVYCYCKGFRGEARRIIENNYHELEMRIYKSIKIKNISIQVELIKRYIRYYTKLIFELEKEKENFDIIRITQLLTYLGTSEECYQILLLVMEIKEKVMNLKNQSYNVVMTVLLSYIKHHILQKMNPLVKIDEVEAALQYKDYRITEVRRDKLISEMFNNIQVKYDFIRKLIDTKYNYENLYQVINNMVKYNLEVIQKIEQFNQFSFSRTSLLIYMFYSIEILNDFDKFIRLRNQLKTKNYKFFEFNAPNNHQQGAKVCYFKINLARHAQKGKISRGEIIQFSNNAPHMFGYGLREFKDEVLTVHQLVIPHLSAIHDQLIEIFLLTNRPQILRKKRGLLGYKKNKDLIFVEMFIDICFNIQGDVFPVYCFLKQIRSDGAYENVKGHIFLNHELRIEGISTMALEQFKMKNGKSLYLKKIFHLIQNFKKYLDLLNGKEKKFQEQEALRQEQGSCTKKLEYNEAEQLLNHFSVSADDLLFRIPKEGTAPETYCISCKFIMTIGKINQKEYKSYLILLQKITFADNTSQIWIESSRNLQSRTRTDTNFVPSLQRELSGSEKHDDERMFTNSDQNCEFSNIDEQKLNQSINFQEYQFQIGPNFHSPFDSQRDLLSLINEEKSQIPNIQNLDQNINSVQIDGLSLQQLQQINKSSQHIKPKQKHQLSYFYKSVSKKSFDVENNQSENQQVQKEQEIRITQTATTPNNGFPSILQKTHLYSKFSSQGNNPRLINVILMIDGLNLLLLLILSFIFYFSFQQKLDDNMKIVGILKAFVTTDYTKNTLLAIGIDTSQYEGYMTTEINYQDKLLELVQNNSEIYLSHYQEYLDDSLVKSTLSNININQYDVYSGNEQIVSAWTEQFYVIYMLQGLYGIDLNNVTTIQRFNSSLISLIRQYQVHKETYEELTIKFQDQLNSNVSDLEIQQNICLILFTLTEILFVITYVVIFSQSFKLLNRILRSCEQISFKALETESIRLLSLQHHYQQSADLNLYKYQFSFKDKCNPQTNFNDFFGSKKVSLRYQQIVQQLEQKKQFLIADEKPYFQRFFFLFSIITYLLGFGYFLTVKLFNSQNINDLQNNLDLFNQNIIYTEQFYQMMMADSVLLRYSNHNQNSKLGEDVIGQYKQLVNESYLQVVTFTQELTSQAQTSYYDLLQFLTTDACVLIKDDMCRVVIDGKLTQGLIYSTDYFSQKVRENIQNDYKSDFVSNITILDLFGLNYIAIGFENIMSSGQWYLIDKFDHEVTARRLLFALFLCIIIIYQCLASFLLFRFFKNRFFIIRQLPYILPPQSVYGEDSFLKTLIYVEKIYDNLSQ
ncbi:unnamed protein product (macronuclear) [Paramecium tetraurelia]|uniref:Transmembrane protein n=1 Tax=Paramecium tetraurelia TaxID=5888 RepID=A0E988_PARTE|nr:uncharacterized protein GSPATT00024586001 [Paramecium tetraurelia]CAK91855.1 unnamed protein product [Paramecium tetraurelia]|eukprot:XP_001459252.1 hypothetical protein (macronuclear) [Paramecium tetraurelia strain d4-2]